MPVDEIIESDILREIIRIIEPKGIARDILRIIRIKGASTIIFKRKDTIAATVPECGEIPIRVAAAADKVLVVPYKIGERSSLSIEEVEDSGIDLIKEEILHLNNSIQKKEDQDLINCLLIGASNTILYEVYQSTPEMPPDNFGDGVDPFDRAYLHSVIRERPILDDVVRAMRIIEDNGGSPDYLIINPREAEDLRRRDELKEAMKTFNVKVIVTNLIDEYFSLVFDSKNSAILIERRPPTIAMSRDYDNECIEISATERINPVCINGDMVVRIQRG